MLISVGFVLMAARRIHELNNAITAVVFTDNIQSWMAVLISLCMFTGAFFIRQIFNLQEKVFKARKEHNARILSAVIKTEEKERQHFARELHDGLGPLLSSIKMNLSAIEKKSISLQNKAIVERTEVNIDKAIDSVKEISEKLSPHLLKRYGLKKAIKHLVQVLQHEKLQIDLNINMNQNRVNLNIELVIYRVTGELIVNTLKHSGADKANINLFLFNDNLEFTYYDNGHGVGVKNLNYTGMGLSNIESRVESLGGKVQWTAPGFSGFFVKIVIPYETYN
jgi:signal transduction histidine kinase